MQLSRFTDCAKIDINMPRWKQRVVGIASYRIKDHNEINILATGKDGNRYYPEPLYASRATISTSPTQKLPSGVLLYLVPINDLEVLERVA